MFGHSFYCWNLIFFLVHKKKNANYQLKNWEFIMDRSLAGERGEELAHLRAGKAKVVSWPRGRSIDQLVE